VAVGECLLRPEARRARPDVWYDLASLTKPLAVTTLVLTEVRDGGLAMDTAAGEVLSELRSAPIGAATVQQLLTHTSGLPAWRPLYALDPDPEAVLEVIAALELEAEPGARVLYSCLDFVLIGRLLERLSGTTLDALFDTTVAAPLDLQRELGFCAAGRGVRIAGGAARPAAEIDLVTSLGLDPGTIPGWEPGDPDDGNARLLHDVAGNAGLFGTARGVWSLAREYLPGGRLLSAAEIRLATTVASSGAGDARALGWQIATAPGCSAGRALSARSFGHTGFTGTSVWVDPKRDAVFVLLTNRHHPGHRGIALHPLRRTFHSLAARSL